jgi:hypothetical protein
LPLRSVVLDIPHQLFLLAIDRNDWISALLILLARGFDLGTLGIAILMRTAFPVLFVGRESGAQGEEQIAHRCVSTVMTHSLEARLQLRHTRARPSQDAHGITFGVQQSLQIRLHAGIFLDELFSSSSGVALALPWGRACFCLDLSKPPPKRVGRGTSLLHHDADSSSLFGFQGQILPPLLLVSQGTHLLVFFSSISLHHAQRLPFPLVCITLFPCPS